MLPQVKLETPTMFQVFVDSPSVTSLVPVSDGAELPQAVNRTGRGLGWDVGHFGSISTHSLSKLPSCCASSMEASQLISSWSPT